MTNRAEALAKALERLSIAVENLDPQSGIPGGYQALIDASNAGDAALEAYRSQHACEKPDGWRPMDESPTPTESCVVLCDRHGNRWIDTWPGELYNSNGCGYPAVTWQPLPAPPNSKEKQ